MLRYKITKPFLSCAINGYLKVLTKLSKKDSQFYVFFFMIAFLAIRLISTFLTLLYTSNFAEAGWNLGFDALWIFLVFADWNFSKESFDAVKAAYKPNTIVSMPEAFPHRSGRYRNHALMIMIFALTALLAFTFSIIDLVATNYFTSFSYFLSAFSALCYCLQDSFYFFYAQSMQPTLFAKAKEKIKNSLENRQRTPVLLPTGV